MGIGMGIGTGIDVDFKNGYASKYNTTHPIAIPTLGPSYSKREWAMHGNRFAVRVYMTNLSSEGALPPKLPCSE